MADYLMHFNPFHDPKNGQFASSGSSGVKGPIVQKYLSSEKAKKEFLDVLKKEGIINDKKKAGESIKSGSARLSKDSDLFVRDKITGLGRILKEDLDNHYYVGSVKLNNDNSLAYAMAARDGNKVNIYAYAKEGVIKQNLAGRAIDKYKNALEH